MSRAGDTVIAWFATGFAAKMELKSIIVMANFSAGIEVGNIGTYAVGNKDMIERMRN